MTNTSDPSNKHLSDEGKSLLKMFNDDDYLNTLLQKPIKTILNNGPKRNKCTHSVSFNPNIQYYDNKDLIDIIKS